MTKQKKTDESFAAAYPNIARWVEDFGFIEVGYDDCNQSFLRALNIGGMIWEGEDKYDSVDEAFRAMDDALATWFKEEYGE